jgi:glycyl-tRNA synthetase
VVALASAVFLVFHPSSISLSLFSRSFILRRMSTNVNHAISNLKKADFDRLGVEDLMKRRFIIAPSFQIYPDSPAGLFDYGPVGCAIKANLIALWRQHFVLNEDMLEVDCTALTPEPILKTSGHVDKFNDFMVKDTKNGQCFRADHLLEAHMDKLLADKKVDAAAAAEYKRVQVDAGDMTKAQLTEAFNKYKIKSPETGNDLEEPFQFNLMFKTQIGPSSNVAGFLRPETAQGIFVNFKRLLEYNGGKLPFAAAQIGNAYRNEIAPRSGLLRVREFTMAEIEHFVHPLEKKTPKFASVADVKLNLLSAASQEGNCEIVTVPLREAVESRLIANETLGYFLGRTQLFMVLAGVKPDKLRFRQHKMNEMAHYANDCWDAEIFTSYGWIEVVGHADRGCFDLTRHSDATGTNLQYYEEFKDGPKIVKKVKANINKQLLGKTFKADQKAVTTYLETLSSDAAKALEAQLASANSAEIKSSDKAYVITREMVNFTEVEEKISGHSISPHVIEPSFGLGRIIYCILEHSYVVREIAKRDNDNREDEKRAYLSLPPIIAPTKVSVLPLVQSDELVQFTAEIVRNLKSEGISSKVDETGHRIGRRYARTDEIGIPFGITIDFDTVEDKTVTLRERDTMQQVRIPISEVAVVLRRLCDNSLSWSSVLEKYPLFVPKD